MNRILSILALAGTLVPIESVSASIADTLNIYNDSIQLQSVEVRGERTRSALRRMDGMDIIGMQLMADMPKILGNADPLHYAQLMPGIQTNSEYDAGLHIQGCDNLHNVVALNGVPVYNPGHLLGIFSVFNGGHFANMQIRKSNVTADSPNRIGGTVDMRSAGTMEEFERGKGLYGGNGPHGELSVGPMSAQATLKTRVGEKTAVILSAREAYLNLLYSQWIKVDGSPIKYGFGDYNITLIHQPDERNSLCVNAYYGHDDFSYDDHESDISTALNWHNALASLEWKRTWGCGEMNHKLYVTNYQTRMRIGDVTMRGRNSSYVTDLGYQGSIALGGLKAGLDLTRHELQPMDPEMEGDMNFKVEAEPVARSLEGSLYVGYNAMLARNIGMDLGVRMNYYHYRKSYYAVDPGLKLDWNISGSSTLTLNSGIHHQYLFQTGFSTTGLPIEMWVSSGERHRPQYVYNLSLQSDNMLGGNRYKLSCELYLKMLYHQAENNSNILDLVYSDFSIDNSVVHGSGRNYGASLMLEKRSGRLTGWVSYSVGRAWRKCAAYNGGKRFPASHERIHELNVVATYKPGKRWSIGGTFVCGSGTPYTRINYMYLLGNRLMTEYGSHNGDRVNPYMRLDLSLNYDFKTRSNRRTGLNFSLYNVTMKKNDLFYRVKVSSRENKIIYSTFRFALPIMPSVNLYHYF